LVATGRRSIILSISLSGYDIESSSGVHRDFISSRKSCLFPLD